VRLSRDLFKRQIWNIGSILCMLHRHRANISGSIKIYDRILIQVATFNDIGLPELDIQGVSVFEILDFHPLKPLSKKALSISPDYR
jgi:hypothetical protein